MTHKPNAAPTQFQGEQCHMMGNIGNEFTSYNAGNFRDNVMEQANYMGNQFQGRKANNPYSNTYNPGWQNPLNSSWSDNNNVVVPNFPNNNITKPQGPPRFQQQPNRLALVENKLDKFLDAISTKIRN